MNRRPAPPAPPPARSSGAVRHAQVWRALDALAAAHGLSPSGLARAAGLDPTSFNPSKRVAANGRPRWPGVESIAAVLRATRSGWDDFGALLSGQTAGRRILPVLGYAMAGRDGFFDEAGYPTGSGWDEIAAPAISDPHAYALKIRGNSMEPAYRAGDLLIVSPAAPIRTGCRIVLRTVDGEVMAKELRQQTEQQLLLASLHADHPPRSIPRRAVQWLARILWVSQ